MLSNLINRQCWLIRRSDEGERDDHGNEIPTEVIIETVCELQQVRRTELGVDDEIPSGEWTAFLLPDEDVDSDDAIAVVGIGEFEIVGDPWKVRNPLAKADSHVEVSLRRTAGPEQGS